MAKAQKEEEAKKEEAKKEETGETQEEETVQKTARGRKIKKEQTFTDLAIEVSHKTIKSIYGDKVIKTEKVSDIDSPITHAEVTEGKNIKPTIKANFKLTLKEAAEKDVLSQQEKELDLSPSERTEPKSVFKKSKKTELTPEMIDDFMGLNYKRLAKRNYDALDENIRDELNALRSVGEHLTEAQFSKLGKQKRAVQEYLSNNYVNEINEGSAMDFYRKQLKTLKLKPVLTDQIKTHFNNLSSSNTVSLSPFQTGRWGYDSQKTVISTIDRLDKDTRYRVGDKEYGYKSLFKEYARQRWWELMEREFPVVGDDKTLRRIEVFVNALNLDIQQPPSNKWIDNEAIVKHYLDQNKAWLKSNNRKAIYQRLSKRYGLTYPSTISKMLYWLNSAINPRSELRSPRLTVKMKKGEPQAVLYRVQSDIESVKEKITALEKKASKDGSSIFFEKNDQEGIDHQKSSNFMKIRDEIYRLRNVKRELEDYMVNLHVPFSAVYAHRSPIDIETARRLAGRFAVKAGFVKMSNIAQQLPAIKNNHVLVLRKTEAGNQLFMADIGHLVGGTSKASYDGSALFNYKFLARTNQVDQFLVTDTMVKKTADQTEAMTHEKYLNQFFNPIVKDMSNKTLDKETWLKGELHKDRDVIKGVMENGSIIELKSDEIDSVWHYAGVNVNTQDEFNIGLDVSDRKQPIGDWLKMLSNYSLGVSDLLMRPVGRHESIDDIYANLVNGDYGSIHDLITDVDHAAVMSGYYTEAANKTRIPEKLDITETPDVNLQNRRLYVAEIDITAIREHVGDKFVEDNEVMGKTYLTAEKMDFTADEYYYVSGDPAKGKVRALSSKNELVELNLDKISERDGGITRRFIYVKRNISLQETNRMVNMYNMENFTQLNRDRTPSAFEPSMSIQEKLDQKVRHIRRQRMRSYIDFKSTVRNFLPLRIEGRLQEFLKMSDEGLKNTYEKSQIMSIRNRIQNSYVKAANIEDSVLNISNSISSFMRNKDNIASHQVEKERLFQEEQDQRNFLISQEVRNNEEYKNLMNRLNNENERIKGMQSFVEEFDDKSAKIRKNLLSGLNKKKEKVMRVDRIMEDLKSESEKIRLVDDLVGSLRGQRAKDKKEIAEEYKANVRKSEPRRAKFQSRIRVAESYITEMNHIEKEIKKKYVGKGRKLARDTSKNAFMLNASNVKQNASLTADRLESAVEAIKSNAYDADLFHTNNISLEDFAALVHNDYVELSTVKALYKKLSNKNKKDVETINNYYKKKVGAVIKSTSSLAKNLRKFSEISDDVMYDENGNLIDGDTLTEKQLDSVYNALKSSFDGMSDSLHKNKMNGHKVYRELNRNLMNKISENNENIFNQSDHFRAIISPDEIIREKERHGVNDAMAENGLTEVIHDFDEITHDRMAGRRVALVSKVRNEEGVLESYKYTEIYVDSVKDSKSKDDKLYKVVVGALPNQVGNEMEYENFRWFKNSFAKLFYSPLRFNLNEEAFTAYRMGAKVDKKTGEISRIPARLHEYASSLLGSLKNAYVIGKKGKTVAVNNEQVEKFINYTKKSLAGAQTIEDYADKMSVYSPHITAIASLSDEFLKNNKGIEKIIAFIPDMRIQEISDTVAEKMSKKKDTSRKRTMVTFYKMRNKAIADYAVKARKDIQEAIDYFIAQDNGSYVNDVLESIEFFATLIEIRQTAAQTKDVGQLKDLYKELDKNYFQHLFKGAKGITSYERAQKIFSENVALDNESGTDNAISWRFDDNAKKADNAVTKDEDGGIPNAEFPHNPTDRVIKELVDKFGEDILSLIETKKKPGLIRISSEMGEGRQVVVGKHDYDKKKSLITLYAARLPVGRAPNILLHELGVHYGFRRMMPKHVLYDIYESIDGRRGVDHQWEAAKEYVIQAYAGLNLSKDKLMEEQIARYVDQNMDLYNVTGKIVLWVKRFLRDIGLKLEFHKDDIMYLFTANVRTIAAYAKHNPTKDIWNYVSPEVFNPANRAKDSLKFVKRDTADAIKNLVFHRNALKMYNADFVTETSITAGLTKLSRGAYEIFQDLKDNVSNFSQKLFDMARPIVLLREAHPEVYKNLNQVIEIASKYRFDFQENNWHELSEKEQDEHLKIFKQTDHGYVMEKLEYGQDLWTRMEEETENIEGIMDPLTMYENLKSYYENLNTVMIRALKDEAISAKEQGILPTAAEKKAALDKYLKDTITKEMADKLYRFKFFDQNPKYKIIGMETYKKRVNTYLKGRVTLRMGAHEWTKKQDAEMNVLSMAALEAHRLGYDIRKRELYVGIARSVITPAPSAKQYKKMDEERDEDLYYRGDSLSKDQLKTEFERLNTGKLITSNEDKVSWHRKPRKQRLSESKRNMINSVIGIDDTFEEHMQYIEDRVERGIKPYFPSVHIGDYGLNYEITRGGKTIIKMQETFVSEKDMVARKAELKANPDINKTAIKEFSNTHRMETVFKNINEYSHTYLMEQLKSVTLPKGAKGQVVAEMKRLINNVIPSAHPARLLNAPRTETGGANFDIIANIDMKAKSYVNTVFRQLYMRRIIRSLKKIEHSFDLYNRGIDSDEFYSEYIVGPNNYRDYNQREAKEIYEELLLHEKNGGITESVRKFNEMRNRMTESLEVQQFNWVSNLRGIVFAWIMSSLSSSLINLSQIPTVIFATMGAKYGDKDSITYYARNLKRLSKFKGVFIEGSMTKKVSIIGAIQDELKATRDPAKRNQLLLEYDALKMAHKSSAIITEQTTVHGRSDAGATTPLPLSILLKFGSKYPRMFKNKTLVFHSAMDSLTHTFQFIERTALREATFMTSYQLERKRGVSHKTAIKNAEAVVMRTNFDYTMVNRPWWQKMPYIGPVAFQFWHFWTSVVQLYISASNAALRGATLKQRREGRAELVRLFAYAFLMGGVQGSIIFYLPMAILSPIVNLFYEDDEERELNYDFHVAVNEVSEYLFGSMGEFVADTLLYGPASSLTGMNISSRVGTAGFMIPPFRAMLESPEFMTNQARFKEALFLSYGAGSSIAMKPFQAIDALKDGDMYSVASHILPNLFGQPIQAAKILAEGGVTTKGGFHVMHEDERLNYAEIAMKAIGFNPLSLAKARETSMAIMNSSARYRNVRSRLIKSIVEGDLSLYDPEVTAFNERQYDNRITRSTIKKSRQVRERREKESKFGLNPEGALADAYASEAWAD